MSASSSIATNLHSLPQELIEHIIDNISHTVDLQSCKLICRAFLPRSHLNLFRDVELSSSDQSARFSSLARRVHVPVSSLTLSSKTTASRSSSPWVWADVPLLLRTLSQECPELQTLVMRRMGSSAFNPRVPSLSITALHASFCHFEGMGQLKGLVRCMPNLTTLVVVLPDIRATGVELESADAESEALGRPVLQTLVTTECMLLHAAPFDVSKLETLKASVHTSRDVDCFKDTIQQTRATLRHLSLDVSGALAVNDRNAMADMMMHHLELGPLRSFTAKIMVEEAYPHWPRLVEASVRMLERSASESMEYVTLRQYVYEMPSVRYVEAHAHAWDVVDRLADRLAGLRWMRVVFLFVLRPAQRGSLGYGPGMLKTARSMVSIVEGRMPKLMARGILSVEASEFTRWHDEMIL